jgi:hypothetical protein
MLSKVQINLNTGPEIGVYKIKNEEISECAAPWCGKPVYGDYICNIKYGSIDSTWWLTN